MIRTTLCALAITSALTICNATLAQSQSAPQASASGATTEKPAYLNPDLPAEQRAADLVHRMTLEEKATQLVNQARAIPRLNIPAYDWWSESLHGVAVNGTTEFPEPIGLAATFDAPAIHEMADRHQHRRPHQARAGRPRTRPQQHLSRASTSGRPTSTSSAIRAGAAARRPTAKIRSSPRAWAWPSSPACRATIRSTTASISTPKHFAVHSGPEPTRHTADVDVSKHDELDTYLPAFRATVTEGKADSVMCAYNSINGQPACANEFLLEDQLRGKWSFKGYVVSDCGAVRRHLSRPSLQAHAGRGLGHQPPARHGQRVRRLSSSK